MSPEEDKGRKLSVEPMVATGDSIQQEAQEGERFRENARNSQEILNQFNGIKQSIEKRALMSQGIATTVEQQNAMAKHVAENMGAIQKSAVQISGRTDQHQPFA
ncbi:MAG: hypothetical protein MI754_15605 [Chromatiales bacterium]|nr:hypothetical protein [Chromatiales bacterium]